MLFDLTTIIAAELDKIETAVTQRDGTALQSAAHRLKNAAARIGATELAEADVQLEIPAKTDYRSGHDR
jgi:HPt (histidine-containing phosphotransfer) domain-containing protein